MLQKEGCCLTRALLTGAGAVPIPHLENLAPVSVTGRSAGLRATPRNACHKKVTEFHIQHLGPARAFEDLKKATQQNLLRHPHAL